MTIVIKTDTENVYAWASITFEYDANGLLIRRSTQFDNGISAEYQYNASGITSQMWTDGSADGSAASWSSVQVQYFEGVETFRMTAYDNGLVRVISDPAGPGGSTISWEDNSADGSLRPWEFIDFSYDDNGIITQKFKMLDNQTSIITDYVNGVISQKTETDQSGGAAGLAWGERITQYDEAGEIVMRTTVFYDGTSRTEDFENGQRTKITTYDSSADPSQHSWERLVNKFDETGAISSRQTDKDNGDTFLFVYEDGNKDAMLELDGDASHDWVAREVLFDEFGAVVARNYYYTPEDIPQSYMDIYEPELILTSLADPLA